MKLRSYLIALVIASLLPVLIFGGVMIVLFGKQQQAAVEDGLLNTARALSHAVDYEFGAWIASLKGLATSEHLESGDLRRFHEQATRVLAAHGGWNGIVLIDLSGQQIVSTRFPFGSSLPRAGDAKIRKQVLETGEPAVSDLFYGPATNQWLLAVGVPVAVDGRPKYVLTSAASPAFLTQLLQDQKIPPDRIGTIVDRNNVTIARTRDLDQHLGKAAAPIFTVRSGEAEEIISHGSLVEGEQVIAGLHRSALSGWTVGLAVPLSMIESPVQHSLLLATGVGAVLLLSGILFAMIIGRKIAAPIAALAQAAGDEEQAEAARAIFPRIYEVDRTARAIRDGADALVRSEEKFRAAVEAAPNGMMMVDPEGKIVMVNAQIEKSFGYTREELFGRSVDVLVPKRSRSKHADQMKQYFARPEPRQLGVGRDLRGVRKDGLEFPVEIGLSPVETAEGPIVLATVLDITERKRAEKALDSRYEELRVLQDISQITLTSSDMSMTLEKILDKSLSIGSFDLGVIRLLDPATDILEPTTSRGYSDPKNLEAHRKKARDNDSGQFSLRTMQRTGPRVEEDVSQCEGLRTWKKEGVRSAVFVPVRTENEILGVIQLGSRTPRKFSPDDIHLLEAIGNQMGVAVQKASAQEETERNLQRIRALHEIDLAITSTLDLPAILDVLLKKIDFFLPDYSATTVRLFNEESGLLEPIACRGLDESEWKAEKWRAGRGIPNAVFETKASRTVRNVQTDPDVKDPEFFRKNGLISYLGVPLIAKGKVSGVLSFYTKREHRFSAKEVEFLATLASQAAVAIQNAQLYQDLVQQADELKRKTRELETANKVKDEFLSVMSHELRTPLSVIMGYAGLIKDGMLGKINSQQDAAIKKVLARGAEQLNMINDIMQTTQLEARAVLIERQPEDLRDLLDQLKSSYDLRLDKKDVSLIWDYPSASVRITTDGAKLKQILQNLINNALKFTNEGAIRITARVGVGDTELGVGAASQSGTPNSQLLSPNFRFIELKVSDTGAGIPKEQLARIFDKFYQVDSSETRLYGGVGLGLYIVKNLTELLGGQIDAQSEVGKGATFTARIPCSF